MEYTVRILKRFVWTTILISAFVLAMNYILLGAVVFREMNTGHSPEKAVQTVAEGLRGSGRAWALDAGQAAMLDEQGAWAMLIDGQGHAVWTYRMPDELPRIYTLNDVAKFTRNYLMDYPVFVWEHEAGLVVVGYPKGSLAKYQHVFPSEWVKRLPLSGLFLLAVNIALALLLSLWIGSRLVRSIRPLTQGIQDLAEDREVYIEPKGLLANLAHSINRASALLRQKNEALKRRDEARFNWIAGISHDIRTPLSMVLGYASEMEENGDLPAEQRRQAGIIRQQSEKLRALVSDLNLVSRLEYDMQPLNKKPVRLSALARTIVSEFLNNSLDDRFRLEVDISDESLQVHADERLLLRAVTNLVQNSIRHNPEGCHIVLKTSRDPDPAFCRLTVSDNGKGIPKSELADLLELPYTSSRKNRSQHGHGLGLPMVARIAKAHRGRLELSSDAGQGMRADIVLPRMHKADGRSFVSREGE